MIISEKELNNIQFSTATKIETENDPVFDDSMEALDEMIHVFIRLARLLSMDRDIPAYAMSSVLSGSDIQKAVNTYHMYQQVRDEYEYR